MRCGIFPSWILIFLALLLSACAVFIRLFFLFFIFFILLLYCLLLHRGSFELAAGIAGQLGSVPLAVHGIYSSTCGTYTHIYIYTYTTHTHRQTHIYSQTYNICVRGLCCLQCLLLCVVMCIVVVVMAIVVEVMGWLFVCLFVG